MDEGAQDVLGTISLITGAIGLVGQGCCCVPVISMFATGIVPLCIFAAIGTGIASVMSEQGSIRGKIGLALGIIDALIIVSFIAIIVAMYGGVVLLAIIGQG